MILILCVTESDIQSMAKLMEHSPYLVVAEIWCVFLHPIDYVGHSSLPFQSAAPLFSQSGNLVLIELGGPLKHIH